MHIFTYRAAPRTRARLSQSGDTSCNLHLLPSSCHLPPTATYLPTRFLKWMAVEVEVEEEDPDAEADELARDTEEQVRSQKYVVSIV